MDYPVALSTQLKQHLRSLRKARGLTQAALAQLLGVGQSRVADIEANPGAVSVEQLLQVLTVLNAQVVIRDNRPTSVTVALVGVKAQAHAGSVTPAQKPEMDKNNPPQGQW
jgi:HTH-type transcriptional regulator/antitoxin HipB